ncbi:hypothetical protein ACLJJ6_04180 [Pediococcus siamensis]|uniref:hypothetical protein n=1 Tax=Pediococcus siamensis TaxID=381829 RepID=UPI0039A0AA8B
MLSEFKIGMLVKCRNCDDLDYPFLAKILNILSSKLVLEILQIDHRDRYKATLIQYTTVVDAKDCVQVQLIRIDRRQK